MALLASDIKLPDDLSKALAPISGSARSSYESELARMAARRKSGQQASGRDVGIDRTGLIGHDIATNSALGYQSLDNALNSVLGNTGYEDYKIQSEYDQNEDLARQIGALNRPSTLEQVLSGLGGAAVTGLEGYALGTNLQDNLERNTSRRRYGF